ncbi:class I SAM-dependent methyltransferase [Haemophilus influenzae]|uniref:class I SAM-dependent methyltransferase n=1 Tax=Haemophilus influenzae TaxID=727 RepID=UPI0034DD140D
MFSRMLDPFMQYSCAYWKDGDNLESAQQAKLPHHFKDTLRIAGARLIQSAE